MENEEQSLFDTERQHDGTSPASIVTEILPTTPESSENLMSNDTIKLERSGSENESKSLLHSELRASLERTLQQLSGDSASENGKFLLLYKSL